MKKCIVGILFLIANCSTAQTINLSIDFTNADETIRILRQQRNPNLGDLTVFKDLHATIAIARKVNLTTDTAISAIRKVLNGVALTEMEKRFQYEFIRENLDSLELFVKFIKLNQSVIINTLKTSFSAYIPDGKDLTVKIYMVLGGFSAGWTFSDPTAFYVGLRWFKNDFTSIIETCKHEIFHNVQSMWYDSRTVHKELEKKSVNLAGAYYLINSLFKEGTASYIADLSKLDKSTPHIKELWDHMQVNISRTPQNFVLADKLLLSAFNSKEFNTSTLLNLYNIIFGWEWNNPGYYMGYQMCNELMLAYGKDRINYYLKMDPTYFLLDFIELSKNKKLNYQFSEELETAVRHIQQVIQTIPLI